MSDRVFAALWLAFCAAVAWLAWKIEAPFSYEPIGPRAFPLLLCGVMAASAGWLLFKPDREPDWPRGALRVKAAVLVIAFLAYAFLFEWLGFPLATALATVAVGRLFEGSWKAVVAGGAGLGVGLWFFFDKLLDVTLPLGRLFSGA
jgi:putative tricarboxylic transport membrane protein